jgi:ATPase subunit of ABC transporter with duplicated ATPase domains
VLKIMAGMDQPSNGEARLTPGYSVGILMQEPVLNEEKTVLGNVEEGAGEIKAKLDRFNEISAEMAEPDADFDALMTEMGKLQEEIDHADAWDLDSQLEQAMDALRCPPGTPTSPLSGGERRRVALCKLLLQKPDLLLLDEPTNHLDAESVLWLEQHLEKYPGAVVAVTHDRYFMDNVAGWILELDRGRAYPYEGNYSTYLEKKAARLEVQGKKDAKLAKRLADELQWVRSNAKARQTKSGPPRRYEEMAAEAERTRKLDFEEIADPTGSAPGQQGDRGQEPQEGLRRPRSHRRPLVHLAAQRHRRGHRPQRRRQDDPLQDDRRPTEGGVEKADSGTVDVGETVKISYVDQSRGGIDPNQNLWEVVSGGHDYIKVGSVEIPSRAYVSVRLQGSRPAEEGRHPLRWRAQPPQPRADAQGGRQPAAPR